MDGLTLNYERSDEPTENYHESAVPLGFTEL